MAPDLILASISDIDYKLKLLSDNLDLLKKLRGDPFSSARTADINTIQHNIGSLLKFLSGIEAMKDKDGYSEQKHGPHLTRLQKQRYNAWRKYFQDSKHSRSDDWNGNEDTVTEHKNTHKYGNEQLQTAPRTVQRDVHNRHTQIQHVETDVQELGQLFNVALDLVVNQEPAVISIEENGGEVSQKLGTANESLIKANLNAKKAWCWRKYCYIVSSLIIIVVVVVLVVVLYNQLRK